MFFINFIKRIFLLCQQNPKKFNKFIKTKKKINFFEKKKIKKILAFFGYPQKMPKKKSHFRKFQKIEKFSSKNPVLESA